MKNLFKKILYTFLLVFVSFSLAGCSLFRSGKNNQNQQPEQPKDPNKTPIISETYKEINITNYTNNKDNTFKIDFQVDKNYKEIQFWIQAYDDKQTIRLKKHFQFKEEFKENIDYSKTINLDSSYHRYDIVPIGFDSDQVIDESTYYYIIVRVKGDSNQLLKVNKSEACIPYIKGPSQEHLICRGFYYDSYYNLELNSKDPISENIFLFAKLSLDISVINKIQTEIIRSNVTIISSTWSSSSQGSGVVVQEEKDGFWIITNSHVVSDSASISVKNYKNEKVRGRLVYNLPSHDLALIWVYKPFENVTALSFATDDPQIGDQIIAIGQPDNQANTVTTGYVQGYEKVVFKEGDGPKFEVIKHNAPIDHGSSGGVLLNSYLKICGINFAGSTTLASDNPESFSIPVSRIREMIYMYNKQQK